MNHRFRMKAARRLKREREEARIDLKSTGTVSGCIRLAESICETQVGTKTLHSLPCFIHSLSVPWKLVAR